MRTLDIPPAAEWLAYRAGTLRLPSFIREKMGNFYDYAGFISQLASGSSAYLNIATEPDADFMVESVEIFSSLQSASEDLFTVQISDSAYGSQWSSAAVPGRDASGLGFAAKKLVYPQFIRRAATIIVNLTNNTGSTCDFFVSFKGYRMMNLTDAEIKALAKRQWYQYVMSVTSIAASTQPSETSLQIMNDANFLLKKIMSWEAIKAIYAAAAVNNDADIKALFRDLSSGYQFQSTQSSLRSILGAKRLIWQAGGTAYSHGEPYELSKPYRIKKNATIQGQFNNLSNTATGLFRVVFEGCKVYD